MERDIKELTLQEIEDIINEEIKTRGVNTVENQTYLGEIGTRLANLIENIFDIEYSWGKNEINVQTHYGRGNYVELKYNNFKYTIVEINYKVKKGKIEENWYSNTQYYYLDKVEITYNRAKKVIDIIEEIKKEKEKNEQYKQEQLNNFVKFLKDNNLTLREFGDISDYYTRSKYTLEFEKRLKEENL